MRPEFRARSFTTVSRRTSVYIYASDPMSAAGARSQLQTHPSIEVVGPADLDRARVAVVVADTVDENAARVVRAIQRDGVPRVVLVSSRFDESGVVAAVAAGVTSFMRRSEATSNRLAEVIRRADEAGCQLPEGLLKKAGATASGMSPVSVGGGSRAFASAATGAAVLDGEAEPEADRADDGEEPDGEPADGGSVDGVSLDGVRGDGVAVVVLSARETDVLRLVADGYDTGDIATRLAYSESTIKGVLAKLMTRLSARNRCHAVAIAVREGLI